jgi:hypothetical protein
MLSFPKSIQWALFEGVEAEGPNQGLRTLFVVGDAPALDICKIAYTKSIKHIYFGAGGRFDYSKAEILQFLYINKETKLGVDRITIENPELDIDLISHGAFPKYNTLTWFIPVVMRGKKTTEYDVVGDLLSKIVNGRLHPKFRTRIYLKYDIAERVDIFPLMHVMHNTYEDTRYAQDILLIQKER